MLNLTKEQAEKSYRLSAAYGYDYELAQDWLTMHAVLYPDGLSEETEIDYLKRKMIQISDVHKGYVEWSRKIRAKQKAELTRLNKAIREAYEEMKRNIVVELPGEDNPQSLGMIILRKHFPELKGEKSKNWEDECILTDEEYARIELASVDEDEHCGNTNG